MTKFTDGSPNNVNMAEQASDKNVFNETNSETSLPERDTDDISVDLVEETDINQETGTFSGKNAEKSLETIENAQEVEKEIVEEIKILAVDQVNEDGSEEQHANEEAPIVPIEDPFDKATKYLAKHNIIGLFQVTTFPLVWFLGTLLLDNQIFGVNLCFKYVLKRKMCKIVINMYSTLQRR